MADPAFLLDAEPPIVFWFLQWWEGRSVRTRFFRREEAAVADLATLADWRPTLAKVEL